MSANDKKFTSLHADPDAWKGAKRGRLSVTPALMKFGRSVAPAMSVPLPNNGMLFAPANVSIT